MSWRRMYVPFTKQSDRMFKRQVQPELPFPDEPIFEFLSKRCAQITPRKRGEPCPVLLASQPKRFPPSWWRLLERDGPNWRAMHYERWSEMRKSKGLPHIVHDQIPAQIPNLFPARKGPQSVRPNDAMRRKA